MKKIHESSLKMIPHLKIYGKEQKPNKESLFRLNLGSFPLILKSQRMIYLKKKYCPKMFFSLDSDKKHFYHTTMRETKQTITKILF